MKDQIIDEAALSKYHRHIFKSIWSLVKKHIDFEVVHKIGSLLFEHSSGLI